MQLLQRLSLFPVVFAAPQELQSKLPADYALACVQCMATTQALAQLARSQGLSEVGLVADAQRGTSWNDVDSNNEGFIVILPLMLSRAQVGMIFDLNEATIHFDLNEATIHSCTGACFSSLPICGAACLSRETQLGVSTLKSREHSADTHHCTIQ